MLLSKPQKYLLDTIRKLGCVRRGQLYGLADRSFGSTVCHVDAMLRQLRGYTDIRLENDLVKLPRASPDENMLEAVDVMLELADGPILDFDVEQQRPILLRFALDGVKVRLFAVVQAQTAIPQIDRRKTERVVLLVGDTPPAGASIPDKHFIALRQKDGTHRFFAGGVQ